MSTTDDSPVICMPRPQTAPEVLSDGERYVKEIRQHKWIGAFLATILGAGGAVGGAMAAANRSQVNQVEVRNLKEATKSLEPRVKKAEANIQTIGTSVIAIQASVTTIADGIEELKKENLDRLKDELEDTKRELRRQERLNNRR